MLKVEQERKSLFDPPFPREGMIAVCPPVCCLLLPCHWGSTSPMPRARQQSCTEVFKEMEEKCSEKENTPLGSSDWGAATSQPLLLWTIL